ncbi:hypothetical protein SOASR032_04070 [Pragia fontium]|uniref:DUF6708 domain-containing protein n=2 Tax=Pragia fontium TaxID=82985 RepID=A0ABQ5LGI9_9GAMM|nr:hypothetical protein QQ39_08485 [Pragia fontium]GKX61838.1 hypothetical protein SOASR032_04070 [Pragia fontium]
MYFIEWECWEYAIASAERRKEDDELEKKSSIGKKEYRIDPEKYQQELAQDHTQYQFSATPYSEGPFYAFNERYLEIRGGFLEERRGLITLISLLYIFFTFATFSIIAMSIMDLIQDINLLTDGGFFFTTICFIGMSIGLVYYFFKKIWKFTRLELFTLRHIRVRFNRITRQVYIQRPGYCGGLLVLEWQQMQWPAAYGKQDTSTIGLRNIITWSPEHTGLPYFYFQAIGKRSEKLGDLPNEAEFIRRYMEYGPDSVAEPKVSSLFPWPLPCFYPMFEATGKNWAKWMTILAFPAVAAIGVGYWLSQLLCWQPRWPQDIEDAGLADKPRPKTTTLDDYSPEIQERLLANADRWEIKLADKPKVRKKRVVKDKPDNID